MRRIINSNNVRTLRFEERMEMRGTKVPRRRLPALFFLVFLCTAFFFVTYILWFHPTFTLLAVYGELSDEKSPETCPDYFGWIHEDLRVWRETGITREMVARGRRTANFRLVILNGSAYVEGYSKSFQSRDTFTVWGILQLLRRYPGRIPDLELMFDCEDLPTVHVEHFRAAPNATLPPPLFAYCADDSTFDIPFPDWSFWGWPEVNIRPWEELSKELQEGNERIKWVNREPYAYWKGNPSCSPSRMNLVFKCNVSEYQDWGARLYSQNWTSEEQLGFNQSNLANQCTHRYKIYIEGRSWSVSEKYILACNSPTLLVKPNYFDFFSRGLMPMKHYWPIRDNNNNNNNNYDNNKCRSIKHAVHWGNNHPHQAQQIGEAGSEFVHQELKMDYVYDYMFHLLSEYSKLLKYEPSVPPQRLPLTSQDMLSMAKGLEKKFMMESMVKSPSHTPPCTMPSPYKSQTAINSFLETKRTSIDKVHLWENEYWQTN